MKKGKIALSDYVIYYLGMTHQAGEQYEETGKMVYKSAWLHSVMKCERGLLMLIEEKEK